MVLRLHSLCDMGMAGMRFPDGGAVLDQPLVLLDAFAIIGDAKARLKRDAA
jgi:hypothetical protein